MEARRVHHPNVRTARRGKWQAARGKVCGSSPSPMADRAANDVKPFYIAGSLPVHLHVLPLERARHSRVGAHKTGRG